MTEKRFMFNSFFIDYMLGDKELKLYEIDNNPSNDLDESNLFYMYSTSEENVKQIVNKLNELNDENEQLRQENYDLKKWLSTVPQMENRIKELKEENEQLKKKNEIAINGLTFCQEKNADLELRNNRQAKRLHGVYSLIENKDWKGLTAIIDEMNEAEELNRLEFEAYYGDNDD